MKDGVYFGLSEAEYFNEKRIGSTLLRRLIDCPTKFWFESFLNPIKEIQDKHCFNQGKIFHKLLLEGESALSADFSIMPSNMHTASIAYKQWRDAQIRPIVREQDVKQARRVLSHLMRPGQVLNQFFL